MGNWNLQYNIQFEVSSIIFMLCMAAYVGIQYNLKTKRNKQFYIMEWIVILATVLDIVTAITISNIDKISVEFNIFLNTLYFWVGGLLSYQFICYSVTYSEISENNTRRFKLFALIGTIIYTILLIINAFTGVFFSIRDGAYRHEPLYFVSYIVPYGLFVVAWMVMLFGSKKKSLGDWLSVVLYIVLSVAGIILQTLFFPKVLLTLFTISIATVIILFFLESNDYVEMSKMLEENIELNKSNGIALETKNRFLKNLNDNMASPLKEIVDRIEAHNQDEGDKITVSREEFEQVKTLCVNVLRKMDDAIEYSSLEISNFDIHEEEYSLQSLLDTALLSIRPEAEAKKLDIDVQIIDAPDRLIGDRARITQVLNKILTNAAEYTDKGSITIRVNSDNLTRKDVLLVISIEDTGIGIAEEQQQRIFAAFEKVDGGNACNKSGLGLGLTFAKEMTERMGGRIGMYSTAGEGTLVYMELPQKRAVIE